MKVIIIGGGASGMMCAINLARRGIDVKIIEQNNQLCKKLLLTGSGKCNYFNENISINNYRCDNFNLVNKIISKENQNKVLNILESIGVVTKVKNGYYYPFSNTATTMKNLFLVEAKKLKVDIRTDIVVLDIIKRDKFILKTNCGDIKCDKVVLATGSNASIKNLEYNSYKILKKMGLKIIDPLPALVMLEGKENYFKDWAGIRCDAKVELYQNNRFVAIENGEVQLTNYGISGICVMNLSGRISRFLKEEKKVTIYINFIPYIDKNLGYKYLEKRNKLIKNRTIIELLESIINYKLLYVILKKCHIDPNTTWNELDQKEKNILTDNIFNFSLDIVNTKGIECAQVVTGGLSLDEVNEQLESKKVPGMYIIGELLNVDGDCGGYNLGFAFMSGLVVGESI